MYWPWVSNLQHSTQRVLNAVNSTITPSGHITKLKTGHIIYIVIFIDYI